MSSNENSPLYIVRLLNWLLVGTIVLFGAATYYFSSIEAERQNAHDTFSPYEVAFAVSQTVNEYLRFEQTLALFALPDNQTSLDDVRLRLDIIIGRLQQFERQVEHAGTERLVVHFMETDPEYLAMMEKVRAALNLADLALNSSDTPNMAMVQASLRAMNRLDSQLSTFAAQASNYSANLYANDKRDLQELAFLAELVKAILIACGTLLVIVLAIKLRLLDRMAVKLRALTSELTQTNQTVTVQNERFDAALNNMTHALCMFDKNGKLAVFNKRFQQLTGVPEGKLEGMSVRALRRKGSSTYRELYDSIAGAIAKREPHLVVRDLPSHKSFAVKQIPMATGGWIATFEDVSEVRVAEARISHMALHDSLTGLPNRAHFRDRLEHAMNLAEGEDTGLAFLFLDLDKFKDINDNLGHQAGDELLRAVAHRMLSALPENYVVARFGGDEFAILTPLGKPKDRQRLCTWLIDQLSRPYHIGKHELRVGVSIGVAEWTKRSAINAEELIRRADVALYQAKGDGRGRCRYYLPQLDEARMRQARLEIDLMQALERNEISLVFQPIICTSSGKPISYEALARWEHPSLGSISPSVFVAMAETNHTIFALGEWVLNEACTQAASWAQGLSVSVNISPVQFNDPALVYKISTILERTGLTPSRLILEITETAFLAASESTLATLKQLKAKGIRFAMDDFGTGYSSLHSLLRFEFDKIKIDQSFIRELPTSANARAVIELVVHLTRKMDMVTTAEGVETAEQRACLTELKCPELQGFLISPPHKLQDLPRHLQPVSSSLNGPGRLSA